MAGKQVVTAFRGGTCPACGRRTTWYALALGGGAIAGGCEGCASAHVVRILSAWLPSHLRCEVPSEPQHLSVRKKLLFPSTEQEGWQTMARLYVAGLRGEVRWYPERRRPGLYFLKLAAEKWVEPLEPPRVGPEKRGGCRKQALAALQGTETAKD